MRADFDGTNVKQIVWTSPADHTAAIAVSAEHTYWTQWDKNTRTRTIYQADLDGKNPIPLIEVAPDWSVRDIAIDAENQKIYWSIYHTVRGKIHREDLDGKNLETLLETEHLRRPFHVEIDTVHRKIYWIESILTPFGGTGTIRWANLDGTAVADLIYAPLQAPCGIDVDPVAGKVYWTDFGQNKIQRANLDGTGAEDLVRGLQIPLGLAVDEVNGKMYWANWATGVIQRANLDGTHLQDLVESGILPDASDAAGLRSISLDTIEKRMYWTTGSQISSAKLDGTDTRSVVVVGPSWINGVFVDENRGQIFWTYNGVSRKVERANLDGTDHDAVYNYSEDLARTGVNVLRGVTVDITTGEAYWAYNGSAGRSYILVGGPKPAITGLADPRFLDLDQLRPPAPEPTDKVSIEAQGKQPVSWGRVRQNVLLQNYPNPFNPETWIPYQLATEAEVEISIYGVDGDRIRRLQLGPQPSGEYITRDKAAYWDGQSQTGELVSSGTYFYHFRADDYSTTKKMVIVK